MTAMQDRSQCPVPLTNGEWESVIETSQTWCDLADEINRVIRETNDALCTIAVAHSHPNNKPTAGIET